jgi:tetratricopeptide (TPR) repeat protein
MYLKKAALSIIVAIPLWANAQEAVLNKDSIHQIRSSVSQEILKPALDDKSAIPDWNTIEKNVKSKYGIIGMEKVYGSQMMYYLDKGDWTNFGKYYNLYYKTAYSRSEYHINNMSWPVFEHISDAQILATAVSTMKYSMEHFDQTNYQAYDTYANLLYKTGKKEEAISWEEKAVQALPDDKALAETLNKMKKGEPTWN